MLGAYIGATFAGGLLGITFDFWLSRYLQRFWSRHSARCSSDPCCVNSPANNWRKVLVTLGVSFIAADFCLMVWGGDPIIVASPKALDAFLRVATDRSLLPTHHYCYRGLRRDRPLAAA